MTVNMFDIYYADLSKNTIGSEQGGIRPVIVIQNDTGNKHSPTVIVLSITSEIKKMYLPTHCIIHKTEKNGLRVNSMVEAEQVKTIDKSRLVNKIGYLDNTTDQKNVLNAYFANVLGQKRNDSLWSRIINVIFKLVKEDKHGSAA